ncbi:hypothetical protein B0H14DRAFT_3635039 [Mycena olivaceomarginata]|nr:hypothetical protein B0H14DRAFT_3635039 [Mycena olivaceomarginata]
MKKEISFLLLLILEAPLKLEPLPWVWWLAGLTLVDGYEQITRGAHTPLQREPTSSSPQRTQPGTWAGPDRAARKVLGDAVRVIPGSGLRSAGSSDARGPASGGVDGAVGYDGVASRGAQRAERPRGGRGESTVFIGAEGGWGVHGREVQVKAERGTGVAAAPRAAKDTAVRWAQSETGVPKRVRGAAQVDAGQNGRGSAQEEGAVAESTRGGTGAGRGYSIEGGMAWRGRACSRRCGGGAVVTWQVRSGTSVHGAVRGQS